MATQTCVDAQGGALVNLIHGYTDNGDPFVRKFTDALLEEVSLLSSSPAPSISDDDITFRYQNHFSQLFTSGSSLENFMTRIQNSSYP